MSIHWGNATILTIIVIGNAMLMGVIAPPLLLNLIFSFVLGFVAYTIFPFIRHS